MRIATGLITLMLTTTLSAANIPLKPGESISQAMVKVRSGDTISLAAGVFKESVILKDRIILKGSGILETTIQGDGRNSVITMNGKCTVSDMTIAGGQNGIKTQSVNSVISNVLITENRGSGILAVSAFPEINQSVIARNGGNGIQASMIGGGTLILDSITIAENSGFGIVWDGTVPVSVTHSLFYKNGQKAFSNKQEQIIASGNLIFPEQSEYLSGNKSEKPEFETEKNKKRLYLQTPQSSGQGCGAGIR